MSSIYIGGVDIQDSNVFDDTDHQYVTAMIAKHKDDEVAFSLFVSKSTTPSRYYSDGRLKPGIVALHPERKFFFERGKYH